MFQNQYKNKRVLITGHTGFKGSWLAAWLLQLGADVAGYAIDIPTQPSHFVAAGLQNKIKHYQGDVGDLAALQLVFAEFKPDVVFHLAAQALVRRSYDDPLTTFNSNALGTLNVLECIRQNPAIQAAIMITSDKAYRNVEWTWGYRENDQLGGEDPYSASKGCAELICYSYMNSYFNQPGSTAVATTRAGNVIGGGDWAEDRIIPDCIRAWANQQTLTLRCPQATRPWQHVLEPISGYLWLGANLLQGNQRAKNQSYNFGPDALTNQSVERLIEAMAKHWNNARWQIDPQGSTSRPEAGLLKLCCDKALADLQWHAILSFSETVTLTAQWYQHYYNNNASDMLMLTQQQIMEYVQLAQQRGLAWTSAPIATTLSV